MLAHLVVTMLAATVSAPASGAESTSDVQLHYDDFNKKWLDPTKWYPSSNCWTGQAEECIKEISNGQLRLAVGNFGGSSTNDDGQFAQSEIYFVDPWNISSITADMTINSFSGVSCPANPEEAHGQAWITGNFFNTGTGDPDDDVQAYLHLQVDASAPEYVRVGAYWSGNGQFSGWVDVGRFPITTTLTGTLKWDQANHQFVAGVRPVGGVRWLKAVVPYWVPDTAPAAFPQKYFSADAISPNCMSMMTSAHTEVGIDNVIINR